MVYIRETEPNAPRSIPRLPSTIAPSAAISALRFKKNSNREFLFPPELRQYHMQTLGRPGGGKTKFLEACIQQDIIHNHGILLFDPTGNFYNDILKWCVQERYIDRREFVLLNPSNYDKTFTFNPLEVPIVQGESDRLRQVRITNVVDATMRAIGSVQGGEDPESLPRYNFVMRNILHVLAENGLTLCDSHLFTEFSNQKERVKLCMQSGSHSVREAWQTLEYKGRREYDVIMEAPINRFARFHSASLSCVVGHPTSTFDFCDVMDEGKIVLVNLGTSGAGFSSDENTILGRLLLNNLVLRTRSRTVTKGEKPRAFYCYIDECHRFMNNDMASAIDELRQFGLRMILSHQNISQLDYAGEHVRGAVLGSTATKIFFSLSAADAQTVSRQVYGGRLDLAMPVEGMEKPHVVGHEIGHLRGCSETETIGEGNASASSSSHAQGGSSGIMYSGDANGMFGLGEAQIGHSEGFSDSESFVESVAHSSFYSQSISHSLAETLIPQLAWLPSQTVPADVQLMMLEQRLMQMPPGECVVCLPHAVSFDSVVKNISDPVVSDDQLYDAHVRHFNEHPDLYHDKDVLFRKINSLTIDATVDGEDQEDAERRDISQASWDE